MKIRFKNTNEFEKLLIKKGYTLRAFSLEIGKCSSFIKIVTKRNALSPKSAKEICEKLNVEFGNIFLIDTLTKVSKSA